jgi:hypothetical protein
MHNQLPKWIDCDLPLEYDIALLRPATLPRGKRLETEDDVYETADNHIVPKLRDRLSSIARKIEHWHGRRAQLQKELPFADLPYLRATLSSLLH